MKPASHAPIASPEPSPAAGERLPAPDRLADVVSGRPYILGSLDDLDETLQQVRAYFGHDDFWSPPDLPPSRRSRDNAPQ